MHVLIVDKLGCVTPDFDIITQKLTSNKCKVSRFITSRQAMEKLGEGMRNVVFLPTELSNDCLRVWANTRFYYSVSFIFYSAKEHCSTSIMDLSPLACLMLPFSPQTILEVLSKVPDSSILPRNKYMERQTIKNLRFPIPTRTGLKFICYNDVLYLEANGSYTNIYLVGEKRPLIVSKSLKYFEDKLPAFFLRPHKKHVVNRNFIDEYNNTDGGYLILDSGIRINVARNRREKLIDLLQV